MIVKKLAVFVSAIFLFSCTKNNSTSNSNPGGPASLFPVISGFSPQANSVDSIVTITGEHFDADPAKDIVKFNGTEAIVKSATDIQLVVTVPAGASTGKITVSVGNNTATSPTIFAVLVHDQWVLKNSFPGSFVGYVTSFRIGSKLYIGMGEGGTMSNLGLWLQEFWQYDATTDVWTQKADFPTTHTSSGNCFTIGNRGYVLMYPGNTLASFSLWQYDTTLNSWTRKNDFPISPEGTIAFGVNNYGYVILTSSKNLWQYDPVSDSWTQKSNYPGTSPTLAASFVIDNFAYVGTGMNGLNTSSGSTEFYQYDPATDTWTKKTDFPGGGRNSASGFSVAGNGYMGTGYDLNGYYLSDFWQYNPVSNAWTQKKDFGGGARGEASGFSGAGQGYLGFGLGHGHSIGSNTSSSTYDDLWQYQP